MYNIYRNRKGEYYYGERKINNRDTTVDTNVSIEGAFDFCHSKNFDTERNQAISKKPPNRGRFVYSEKRMKAYEEFNNKMNSMGR